MHYDSHPRQAGIAREGVLTGGMGWQIIIFLVFFFWRIILNVTLKKVYYIIIEPQLFSQLCSRVSVNDSQVSKQC